MYVLLIRFIIMPLSVVLILIVTCCPPHFAKGNAFVLFYYVEHMILLKNMYDSIWCIYMR